MTSCLDYPALMEGQCTEITASKAASVADKRKLHLAYSRHSACLLVARMISPHIRECIDLIHLILRQWLLRIQASFTEDYSCRYSSGFAPDSLTSAGGYAFPIANSGSKDKDFYTLFCLLFLIILVFLYLCPPNRFRTDVSAVRIKREPGVNPGQSRCCEAPSNEVLIRTFATDMRLYIGKASR